MTYTKTAGAMGVIGKLMKTPGLAARAGGGAAIGAVGGGAATADGRGGAARGIVGGALLGAAGGAASSRIFRRNVGRALEGRGAQAIKTKAFTPAYHAPGAAERKTIAKTLKKDTKNLKRIGKKAIKGDARRFAAQKELSRKSTASNLSREKALGAFEKQRARVAPTAATGRGPMPAGVGRPQGPVGFGVGRALGTGALNIGRAAGTARRVTGDVLGAPGRLAGNVRKGMGSLAGNVRRGFAQAAAGN